MSTSSRNPYSVLTRHEVRRMVRHLVGGGTPERLRKLVELLTDLPFLELKTEARMVGELAKDFSEALEALPRGTPGSRTLKLLEEAIRRDMHFIARHPTTLFQCLWNSCWWYDCVEGARNCGSAGSWMGRVLGYAVSITLRFAGRLRRAGRATGRDRSLAVGDTRRPERPPVWKQEGRKLRELLEAWRTSKEGRDRTFRWVRSLRPPRRRLGSPQRAILRGHEGPVTALAYSPDGRRIVTGGGPDDPTVRVWDAGSGAELECLHGHRGSVLGAAYSPNGHWIVSGSSDGTMWLVPLRAPSGRLECSLFSQWSTDSQRPWHAQADKQAA